MKVIAINAKILNEEKAISNIEGRYSIKDFILKIAEPYGLTDSEIEKILYSGEHGPFIIAGIFIIVEIEK